jgi:methanogenic corrinoid protein MtbC1
VTTDVSETIDRITTALLSVNKVGFTGIFDNSGMQLSDFTEEILVPVLDRIGERWHRGEISLAQVYMSGRLCEKLLQDNSAGSNRQLKEIGLGVAVLEDFHVLGKRIVCSVLYAAGYGFTDYGPVSLDDLVEKVEKDKIRILLVSTLMLSSALRVRLLKERLVSKGLDVKVIVGGAPFRFDPNLWREVGADATSPCASGVVAVLQNLVAEATHVNM